MSHNYEELCGLCLVAGRSLKRFSRYEEIRQLTEILTEIKTSVDTVTACFECFNEVQRSIAFTNQARYCHQILLQHQLNDTQCPPRKSRLSFHCGEQINIMFTTEIEANSNDTTTTTYFASAGNDTKRHLIDEDLVIKDLTKSEDWQNDFNEITDSVKYEATPWVDYCSKRHHDSTETVQQQYSITAEVKTENKYSFVDNEPCRVSSDSDAIDTLELQVKANTKSDVNLKKKKERKKRDKRTRVKGEKDVKFSKKAKRKEEENIRIIELTLAEVMKERNHAEKEESYINSAYKCTNCILPFVCQKELKEHLKTKHDRKLGKYSCIVCARVSATMDSFTSHYRRHLKRYECVECGKRNADKKAIIRHCISTHQTEGKKYKCHCGKISSSPEAHRYHQEIHKARAACPDCDKTFRRSAGLLSHRLTVHKMKNAFPCDVCGKVLRWKTSLKKHKEKHENKQSSSGAYCEPCGVSFTSHCSYKRHLRSSLKHVTENDLKFVCAECNRRFSNKTKLRDHIEEKHLFKAYKCHICHKPSKNRVCLDQHVRNVHKGRANDKMCHHCGKGFPTKVQLESHIRSHTGERPYICEFCPTTFSQQSNLYKHNRQVHLNLKSKKYQNRRPTDSKPVTTTDTAQQMYTTPIHNYVAHIM